MSIVVFFLPHHHIHIHLNTALLTTQSRMPPAHSVASTAPTSYY